MTIKEELEILRGEPIRVFAGDPKDIPCAETSDSERLCKHPVVSVSMITYNHEPYIRQAIEGVMMQKTDFEFELVIGEDCSTDRTREICFEYQKLYPDKIRVLWCDHNLYRNPHPAGDNSARNMAHCRGEFIALCEGDDYWIDPLKLQKQVDVMRKYPNVGFCFCGARDYWQNTGIEKDYNLDRDIPIGCISGGEYVHYNIFGRDGELKRESYVRTATSLVRVSSLHVAQGRFEILRWGLRLGDVPLWLSLSCVSDVFYLPDQVSVYRINDGGACAKFGIVLRKDNLLSRVYFLFKTCTDYADSDVSLVRYQFFLALMRSDVERHYLPNVFTYLRDVLNTKIGKQLLSVRIMLWMIWHYYRYNAQNIEGIRRIYRKILRHGEFSRKNNDYV